MSLSDFFNPKPKKSSRRKSSSRPRKEPKFTSDRDDKDDDYGYQTEYARKRAKSKSQDSFGKWLRDAFIKAGLAVGGVLGAYSLFLLLTLPDITTLADV